MPCAGHPCLPRSFKVPCAPPSSLPQTTGPSPAARFSSSTSSSQPSRSSEVCWCDGGDLPTEEAKVLDKVGQAIKCNSACAGASHDLLIPVSRTSTETTEYSGSVLLWRRQGVPPNRARQAQPRPGNRRGVKPLRRCQRCPMCAVQNLQQDLTRAIRSFKADLGKIIRTGTDTQPRDLESHRASASIMAQLESVLHSCVNDDSDER